MRIPTVLHRWSTYFHKIVSTLSLFVIWLICIGLLWQNVILTKENIFLKHLWKEIKGFDTGFKETVLCYAHVEKLYDFS